MVFDYFHFILSPALFISGFVTILIMLAYHKDQNLNGLSTVAISDAMTSMLSGVVMLICTFRIKNACTSTDMLLTHAMILFPFISGFISSILWNYQCWNEIKTSKEKMAHQNKAIKILSTNLIPGLFLLPLLIATPQKVLVHNTDNRSDCSPNVMLSYSYTEKCKCSQVGENELFDKFLQDLNKSRTELIYSNKRIHLFNDTAEIVQKIYQLVGEKMSDMSNHENGANRAPRKHHKENTTRISLIYEGSSDNSNTTIVQPHESDFQKHKEKALNRLHSLNANDKYKNNTNDQTSNNTEINKKIVNVDPKISANEEEPQINVSDSSTNYKDISVFMPNKTFYTSLTLPSINSTVTNKDGMCSVECILENVDEKTYLLLLLVTCFLIPIFSALILYNKASMQAMLNIEQASRHETLLRSAKWAMILPVVLILPNFFSFFVDTMLCTSTPNWLTPVLYTALHIHPILRNIFDVSTMKASINCKGDNKVHPAEEENTAEIVTEPQTEHNEQKEKPVTKLK